MQIEIPDRLQEKFVEAVADLARYQCEKRITEAIEKEILDFMNSKLEAMITDKITAEVEKVLTEGWPLTDSYGRETGRHTLGSVVLDKLKSRSGYSQSSIERITHEVAGKIAAQELKQEIEEARKAFRKKVDGMLNAKTQEALRSAFGLCND